MTPRSPFSASPFQEAFEEKSFLTFLRSFFLLDCLTNNDCRLISLTKTATLSKLTLSISQLSIIFV